MPGILKHHHHGGKGKVATSIILNQRPNQWRAHRAGIIYPVGRLLKYIKRIHPGHRVSHEAAVFLAGVLEYVTFEILDLAVDAAKKHKRQRITPRYVLLGVRNDDHFDEFLGRNVMMEGGVVPFIHEELLRPPKQRKPKLDPPSPTRAPSDDPTVIEDEDGSSDEEPYIEVARI